MNIDAADFFDSLEHAEILDGGTDGTGLHFNLADGRVIVIIGEFSAYVGVVDPKSIQ